MILSSHTDGLLPLHQYQGKSNDCGPFVAAMILNYFNHSKIKGTGLGLTLNRISWYYGFPLIRRIPNWATFPWGITQVLKENNIYAKWQILQKPKKLIDIIETESLIIVLVGEFKPVWSHYKVLIGYDEMYGWGFIDPAISQKEIHWQLDSWFLKYWKNYGNQVIYIDRPV